MKHHTLYILVVCVFAWIQSNAQSGKIPGINTESFRNIKSFSKIDSYDTVIFDMCKAVRKDDKIDIPVSIISDDQINSLDFSLKFNLQNLIYDTVINNTNYIQLTQYYSPSDYTLRVSSNSFNSYEKDSVKLAFIRFKTTLPKLQPDDLNSIMAYLNGDKCSVKIIDADCHVVVSNNNLTNKISAAVYPNPAIDYITIQSEENAMFELYDSKGIQITQTQKIRIGQKLDISLPSDISAFCFLRIYNEHNSSIFKVYISTH